MQRACGGRAEGVQSAGGVQRACRGRAEGVQMADLLHRHRVATMAVLTMAVLTTLTVADLLHRHRVAAGRG